MYMHIYFFVFMLTCEIIASHDRIDVFQSLGNGIYRFGAPFKGHVLLHSFAALVKILDFVELFS